MVAQMVFTIYKCSLQRSLFLYCARFRGGMEEDFYRLRRLAMDAAFFKIRCGLLNLFPEQFGTPEERALLWTKIETWVNDKINAFINMASSKHILSWDDYERMDHFPVIEEKRIEWGHPALDLELVRSSHIWLPLPNQAATNAERASVLQFWKEAAKFIAKRAISRREQYEMADDTWVLENIAAVLAQTSLEDERHLLWMPILDLPIGWHAFPESLLSALHRVALTADVVPEHYVEIVQNICLHALARSNDGHRWGASETVWDSLLGLDDFCQIHWKDKHHVVVKSNLETYRLWMRTVPLTGERLASFAAWLEKSAADALRLEALLWIDQLMRSDEHTQIFKASFVQNRVASLINETWNREEQNIRNGEEVFTSFRRILNWLVGEQNRYALAVSSRLGLA